MDNIVEVKTENREYNVDIIENRIVINNTDVPIGTMPYLRVSIVDEDHEILFTEDAIITNATKDISVTLPEALNRVRIKNKSSGYAVNIITQNNETIDDEATAKIFYKNEALTFVSDGNNWCIF